MTPVHVAAHTVPRWWASDGDLIAAWDRPDGRELVWVCLECRHHHPRGETTPSRCEGCGAPAASLYVPVED